MIGPHGPRMAPWPPDSPAHSDHIEQLKRERKELKEKLIVLRERKEGDTRNDTQALIAEVCDGTRDFLLDKNEQYGDSAINPVRIFSKASPEEQLLVRIDDKLSRLVHGDDRLEADDDVLDDLIGYLILYKVARRRDADA